MDKFDALWRHKPRFESERGYKNMSKKEFHKQHIKKHIGKLDYHIHNKNLKRLINLKKFLKLKHPKTSFLIISIILAYILFTQESFQPFIEQLTKFRYLGALIAGFFFSLGFTAPFSIGYFLIYSPKNIIIAAILGGIGATLSNLILLKTFQTYFLKEFKEIENTKSLKFLIHLFKNHLPTKIRIYLLYTFIGIIIASPIPNEIAILMIASIPHIKKHNFAFLTFILNAIGIYIILLIARIT